MNKTATHKEKEEDGKVAFLINATDRNLFCFQASAFHLDVSCSLATSYPGRKDVRHFPSVWGQRAYSVESRKSDAVNTRLDYGLRFLNESVKTPLPSNVAWFPLPEPYAMVTDLRIPISEEAREIVRQHGLESALQQVVKKASEFFGSRALSIELGDGAQNGPELYIKIECSVEEADMVLDALDRFRASYWRGKRATFPIPVVFTLG